MSITLHPLGRKIFFDRYALKDPNRKNLKKDDLVIAIIDELNGQRELGSVMSINDTEVTVQIEDGEQITRHISQLDVPLEKTPEETITRVARGVSSVEKPEKQAEWQKNFEWLMDEFRFVPGGRILTMAGTDQQLTAFNCFVLEGFQDSRHGIFQRLEQMAEIMSRGGGVGINISALRPKHAYVKGVNGRSSGSVSWAELFSFTTNLIEQAGCFSGDTRIATDKGLIPIKELVNRIENNEQFYAQTHEGMRKITDKFRNGIKPSYKITTKRGYQITVSGNHPMLYLEDSNIVEIRAENMVKGDKILLLSPDKASSYISGSNEKLEKYQYVNKHGMSRKIIRQPEYIDEDLAYLLGYSYGDGYVRKDKYLDLAMANAYPKMINRIVRIIKEKFGIEPVIRQGDGDLKIVSVASVELISWLKLNNILKQKTENISVPERIFRTDIKAMMSFVAGWFDADGTIKRGKKSICGTSISKSFIQDIQKILSVSGIVSSISEETVPNKNWKTKYIIGIAGNINKQRFFDNVPTSKNSKIAIGVRDMSNLYPSAILGKYPKKYSRHIWDGTSEIVSANQINKSIALAEKYQDKEAISELTEILNITQDEVISVEHIGNIETFDITVEHTHKVSGNGIYTNQSRRGALMCILDDWHPDILTFINYKRKMNRMTGANISVNISDKFMETLARDGDWDLVFPDTSDPEYNELWRGNLQEWIDTGHEVIRRQTIKASKLWNEIVEGAWSSAEPGIWFGERYQKMSNSYYYKEGSMVATNPCAEQGLPGNGICNLGAINLSKFYDANVHDVKWNDLRRATQYGVRFLDNVIDHTPYFSDAVEKQEKRERRIGLGTFGIAELLLRLKIRYGSDESVEFLDRLYRFIAEEAYLESARIAIEKGSFYFYDSEKFLDFGFMKTMPEHVRKYIRDNGMRNVTVLTQAPTGTTSTMVNSSGGIEPFFSWKFYRKSRLGLTEENVPLVQEWLNANPDKTENDLPEYFVTAMQLEPEGHVKVQAAIQRWVDSSISKTNNLPKDYTVEDVSRIYRLMYELGCKGGTIYRDGSRNEQVLMNTDDKRVEEIKKERNEVLNSDSGKKEGATGGFIPAGTTVFGSRPADITPTLATPVSYKIAKRDESLSGKTVKVETAFGYAYVTVNSDDNGQPFEVFVSAPGKAGSDLQADAEGLGRMMSLMLRSLPAHQRKDALEEIAAQLKDISGTSVRGFGEKRIASLPDAIAYAIQTHVLPELQKQADAKVYTNRSVSVDIGTITIGSPASKEETTKMMDTLQETLVHLVGGTNGTQMSSNGNGNHAVAERKVTRIKGALICPTCKNHTLILEEGCKKCQLCGYSAC